MKKYLVLVFCLVMLMVVSSCAPREWFLMNSNGIFTYDRYTGKVELLWETKGGAGQVVDTTKVQKNSVPPSEVEN